MRATSGDEETHSGLILSCFIAARCISRSARILKRDLATPREWFIKPSNHYYYYYEGSVGDGAGCEKTRTSERARGERRVAAVVGIHLLLRCRAFAASERLYIMIFYVINHCSEIQNCVTDVLSFNKQSAAAAAAVVVVVADSTRA